MHFSRRFFALAALALGAAYGSAQAAGSRAVVYVSPYQASSNAYLIDWQGSTRAHVVTNQGNRDGGVSRSGSQRVLTLDTPFSQQYFSDEFDPCINENPMIQQDTLQLAVKTLTGSDNRGTSAVVELGTLTTLNGCNAGFVEPFGALTDPGFSTNHLALNLRSSVTDLVPGVSLAGPSEEARDDSGFPANDVFTFQAGGLGSFGSTGHVFSAAFDADNWLQIGLPSGQRGYTRISVDRRTGAETWLDADWAGGLPTTVWRRLMVKPAAGAGFGNLRQTSRMWQSGLSSTDLSTFSIYLYQTGNGERVTLDLMTGVESRTPITWVFNGANVEQTRVNSSFNRVRTWAPLANGGARAHFVMESENYVYPDGSTAVFIKPRVNFYTDKGAATPPVASSRR